MSKFKFKQTQQYNNIFLPIVLGLVSVVAIVKGVTFLLAPEPQIGSAFFLFGVAISFGILIWGLTKIKLKVAISEENIKFKLSPIHKKKQSISWKEVEKCEIKKTSKVAQWLGKNINFNREKTYSLSGRNGLAIKTKKGEHYFIGCSDIDGLQEALDNMNVSC